MEIDVQGFDWRSFSRTIRGNRGAIIDAIKRAQPGQRRIHNGPPGICMPAGLSQSQQHFFNRSVGTQFEVHAQADITEIDLYDEIGYWGVDARQFRSMLRSAGDVLVRINSPGGDVFDGITMYNDLLAHEGTVTVEVVGIAASIATVIAQAADPGRLRIADNAFFMIHNAWTLGVGDRHDMSHYANILGEIDGALNRVYQHRMDDSEAAISELMDDETWWSGASAVDAGIADEVFDATEDVQAHYDLSGYKNTPKELRTFNAKEHDKNTRDIERALTRDAGFTRSQARAILSQVTEDMLDAGPGSATRGAGTEYDFEPLRQLAKDLSQ